MVVELVVSLGQWRCAAKLLLLQSPEVKRKRNSNNRNRGNNFGRLEDIPTPASDVDDDELSRRK